MTFDEAPHDPSAEGESIGTVGHPMAMDTQSAPSEAMGGDELVVNCPSCGQKNRVLREKLTDDPTCGSCRTSLFSGEPVNATDASFNAEVERSPIPVLVDFWAPWCGPCRAVAPALERIAAARAGKLKLVKVDVDQNPRSAARFAVQAIPTLILFRDGQAVDQIRGALPQPHLEERLARYGL